MLPPAVASTATSRGHRAALIALLLAAAVSAPGCVAAVVAAGAAATYGTVRYYENEAYTDFGAPMDVVWDATVASMKENGYPFGYQLRPNAKEGHLEVDNVKITVERREDEGRTRVRVRVGTFDTQAHRERAESILQGVARRL